MKEKEYVVDVVKKHTVYVVAKNEHEARKLAKEETNKYDPDEIKTTIVESHDC